MKVAIGCDHAAYIEKKHLIVYLESKLNIEIIDFGTHSEESVDYAEYGHMVGKCVSSGAADRGIVICGSGIGISIAANKIKGVRAALCISIDHAIISRKHNDANVLALGARFISLKTMLEISENWLKTDFEGGRHQNRIDKIEKI